MPPKTLLITFHLNEMIHDDDLDRECVLGRVLTCLENEQYQVRLSRDWLSDGFSAENYFFKNRKHVTKHWRFGTSPSAQVTEELTRYVSSDRNRNPPYDFSHKKKLCDIKLIRVAQDEDFVGEDDELDIPCTKEQRLNVSYFYVYLVKSRAAGENAPGAVIVNYRLLVVKNIR